MFFRVCALFFVASFLSSSVLAAVKGQYRWNISSDSAPLKWRIVNASSEENYETILSDIRFAFDAWQGVDSSYISFEEVDSNEQIKVEVKSEKTGTDNKITEGNSITSCSVEVGGHALGDETRHWLIHEIGHCLGLRHSVVPGSIMSYRSGSTTTVLSEDDRFALTLLYPISSTEKPVGCATATVSANGGGGAEGMLRFWGSLIVVVLALLMTLVIRRKKVIFSRPIESSVIV